METKIGYVMNIDVGPLERKSILLAESIIKFVEPKPLIIIVKPNEKRLSDQTLEYIQSNGISFYEIEMRDFYEQNIMMSKLFIAAFAENIYRNKVDYLLFLDNDTLFLNQLEKDIFNDNFLIGLRPTDYSERSLTSFDDCVPVWKFLIDKFNIAENKEWEIKTVINNVDTFASFNSGFILTRTTTNFFEKWYQMAVSLKDDVVFLNLLNQDKKSLYYIDQILLSCVLMKDYKRSDLKIMNAKYNFSLEPIIFNRIINFLDNRMIFMELPIGIDSLVHLHYHSTFERRKVLKYFKNEEHLNLIGSFVPFCGSKKFSLNDFIWRSIILMRFILYCLKKQFS